MLQFVSSIINHRVNLGKLLKIFQVAKNHNEAFTSSNVYSIIHHQQRLEHWHRLRVGSLWNGRQSCLRAPWPWGQAPEGFSLCLAQVEEFAGTRDWCWQKCLAFTDPVSWSNPAGSSVPHSHSLTPPRWDEGENQKS